MDLRLSRDEERFRDDLVAWLRDAPRPAGLRDYGATPTAADVEPGRAWHQQLVEGGRVALSWPAEHGGGASSVVEQAIFAEEMARAGVPRQLSFVSMELAGPMIMAFGTEAQRSRFLEPIRRGRELWCQLFSEPGAGSDLAALATRADPSGEGWAVTGQKVWTSGAHYADLGLLLARTDPDARAHRGISCFLLPMDRPGIEVRPLRQMDGEEKFNEVFLDGVPVGPDDLLGEPGQGWEVALSTLGRERLSLGSQAVGLLAQLDEARTRAGGFRADPVRRQEWVALWSRVRLLRLTWLRGLAGTGDPRPVAVLKLLASELQRDVTRAAGAGIGPALVAGSEGEVAARFLAAPGQTVAGGTSEIQRTILGERVLGLPREPRP